MRVLVVDDEVPARHRLQRLLEELGHEMVAEAGDYEQALNAVREFDPEVVLLDIALPGMDGMEIAKKLQEMQVETAVIFVTAHNEFAVEAFEREALDYLLKPVKKQRLEQALQRAQRREPGQAPQEEYHTIRQGKEVRRLALNDIWYFKAEDKVVLAFDGLNEYVVDGSLKQLEERYGDRFIRTHRAYLVDCKRIERLEGDVLGGTRVWLRGYDRPLPVSRRLATRVRAAMHC
ncbi:MAG: response regulator transcription factor [Gammaproteobacteria bacterium]|nr:response regulator transcription factor [Gammaproteobacteria bacterium]